MAEQLIESWMRDGKVVDGLMPDFHAICAFGGRRSGSGQDSRALDWALGRLAALPGQGSRVDVPYDGWHCRRAELTLLSGNGRRLACNPLLRSMSTPAEGLELELVDLGLGREEDFMRAGDQIRGRAVLVRHEYPFAATHMHRRRKYDRAVAQGAAAFLIANPWEGGGLMSGSSGRGRGQPGIPAAYVDYAAAAALRQEAAKGTARIRFVVLGEEDENARAGVGIFQIPGGRPGQVFITAHMDGHDLAQSALDNATGVAVALAAARALAPQVSDQTASLCIAFFCAEEWALSGSARYLEQLPDNARANIKLDINLDTVAGDDSLTALLSDFPALEGYVRQAGQASKVAVDTWLPFMPNSDHANFARHGIPAFRLVAGFNRPDSRVRNILSAGDVPGIIQEREMLQALRLTLGLGWIALRMSDEQLDALKAR